MPWTTSQERELVRLMKHATAPHVRIKELALQFLVALALIEYGGNVDNLRLFMDARQIFVFALVTTIYFPCIATAAVLGRELGWRSAGAIMALSIGLAVLVGGVANQVLLRL